MVPGLQASWHLPLSSREDSTPALLQGHFRQTMSARVSPGSRLCGAFRPTKHLEVIQTTSAGLSSTAPQQPGHDHRGTQRRLRSRDTSAGDPPIPPAPTAPSATVPARAQSHIPTAQPCGTAAAHAALFRPLGIALEDLADQIDTTLVDAPGQPTRAGAPPFGTPRNRVYTRDGQLGATWSFHHFSTHALW